MSKPTVGTYFSGGGIGLALVKDKVDIAFGVEYDPAISEVYRANISDRIITARVQDIDVKTLEKVDLFQVSPVCKEFSNAKVNGKESAEELGQAAAICAYLDYHKPRYFVLENVRGYIRSKSFSMIVVKLSRLGYTMRYTVENSADYGVPQTRERLILRAALDCPLPSLPDYVGRWVGWYEAIFDLIPGLPEGKFGDWQLTRLPFDFDSQALLVGNESNRDEDTPQLNTRTENLPAITIKADSRSRIKAFLVESKNANQEYGKGYRNENESAFTVVTDGKPSHMPKAFIVPGDNASNETVRYQDEPMVTVRTRSTGQCPARAFIVDGQPADNGRFLTIRDSEEPIYTVQASADKKPSRAWLSQGRIVQMTPRALARFQSIPDWYQLPQKNGLACTCIGNGIPSRMGQGIIEAMLGLNKSSEAAA